MGPGVFFTLYTNKLYQALTHYIVLYMYDTYWLYIHHHYLLYIEKCMMHTHYYLASVPVSMEFGLASIFCPARYISSYTKLNFKFNWNRKIIKPQKIYIEADLPVCSVN